MKNKRTIILLSICITICIVAAAFIIIFKNTDSESNKSENAYISITATHETKQNNVLESTIYQYDLTSEKCKRIASVPYTSQYPLAVYQADENCIYYTAAHGSNGDQLFRYDCSSGESKMLTKNFFAINNIFPVADNLYLVGADKDDYVRLYIYNKKNKSIQRIKSPHGQTITTANIDPHSGKIYIATDSLEEEYAVAEKQKNGIDNTVFCIESNKYKKLFRTDKKYVRTILPCRDYLFYLSADRLFPPKQVLELKNYSISDKNNDVPDATPDLINDIGQGIYYDASKKTLYYINSAENCLIRHNLETNQAKVIYRAKDKEAINNALVIQKK